MNMSDREEERSRKSKFVMPSKKEIEKAIAKATQKPKKEKVEQVKKVK